MNEWAQNMVEKQIISNPKKDKKTKNKSHSKIVSLYWAETWLWCSYDTLENLSVSTRRMPISTTVHLRILQENNLTNSEFKQETNLSHDGTVHWPDKNTPIKLCGMKDETSQYILCKCVGKRQLNPTPINAW